MKFEFVKTLSDKVDVIDVSTIIIDITDKVSMLELDKSEMEILTNEKQVRFHKKIDNTYSIVYICYSEIFFNLVNSIMEFVK